MTYDDHCTDLGRQLQRTSAEMDLARQTALVVLAPHGALGATGSICTHWLLWTAVVCVTFWRSALMAKRGDDVGVVLSEKGVELLSWAGMWPDQAGCRAESGGAFQGCFDLSSVQGDKNQHPTILEGPL